ncbi:MAG TPA: primosomal protein N', partial [Bacteroidota bacterium]
MSQFLVDIALPVPIDHPFTYIVPPELQPYAKPGMRAVVPFGRKSLTGVIVGIQTKPPARGLKPIRDILDVTPSFSDDMLKLTKWIAEYYFAPWGETLKAAAPQGFLAQGKRNARLVTQELEHLLTVTKRSAPKQYAVLLALQKNGTMAVSRLQTVTKTKSLFAILNDMAQKGWIEVFEDTQTSKTKPKLEKIANLTDAGRALEENGPKKLSVKQSAVLQALRNLDGNSMPVRRLLKEAATSLSILKTLEKYGLVAISVREVLRTTEYDGIEEPQKFVLNSSQRESLNEISRALDEKKYATFLLHGVTGSGKTQVYIEAIRHTLAAGKTAIVLVPEISLTPQIVRRFKAYFGSEVAVMHSQMSAGERYDAWRMARQGNVKIVIGPRSAVFAPLSNLGLIVVDEEHEGSYKQFDATPRYHARDVAIVRAHHANAVVVLGSATPSAESYHNTLSGKYRLLEMPERVDNATMPRIDIVDMTKERRKIFEHIKQEVKEKQLPFP